MIIKLDTTTIGVPYEDAGNRYIDLLITFEADIINPTHEIKVLYPFDKAQIVNAIKSKMAEVEQVDINEKTRTQTRNNVRAEFAALFQNVIEKAEESPRVLKFEVK